MKRNIYYSFLICLYFLISFPLKAQSDFPNVQITTSNYDKSETSVAMDPNDNNYIFVGVNVQNGSSPRIGNSLTTSALTNLNSWTNTDIMAGEDRYDPSVAYDLNHSLYYVYIRYNKHNDGNDQDLQTYIIRSSNEGLNFGGPYQLSSSDYTGADKPFVTVDNNLNSSF